MQPSDACVEEGQTFTCAATRGYPGSPSYAFYNWTDGTNSDVFHGQIYEATKLGNFSLVCEVKYTHPDCPQHSAACYANYTGTVTYGEYRSIANNVFVNSANIINVIF